MDWERVSNDEIDVAVDHFAGLSAAGQAKLCELISQVDVRQSWMTDGARTLADWVAARLRVRHSTAVQLVGVARRLQDLPRLGNVSLTVNCLWMRWMRFLVSPPLKPKNP